MTPDCRRGFSVAELLVTMALFTVLGLLAYAMLDQGMVSWRKVSGNQSASLQLAKVQRFLQRDLVQAGVTRMSDATVPPSLAGAGDGKAIWFLSAVDPLSGEVARKTDGRAFWMRNILYYLVVPGGHTSCAGGAGPGGLDDRCPHKVLIRKVIDQAPPSDPEDATTEETLLTDVSAYLTRPLGPDTSAMSLEPGVERVEALASQMLWFDVKRPPDPRFPGEVMADLRACSLDELRQNLRLGVDPLYKSPFTQVRTLSVFPRN